MINDAIIILIDQRKENLMKERQEINSRIKELYSKIEETENETRKKNLLEEIENLYGKKIEIKARIKDCDEKRNYYENEF